MQQNYNGDYNRGTANVHRHRLARTVLYSLLLASSAVLLGLTARRIHYTRTLVGGFERIIVELLITSIVAIIGSALLIRALLSKVIGFMGKTGELATLLVIWIMSAVGAAIVTHDWMHLQLCTGIFKECRIQQAIKAFSWIVFGLTTILLVLRLINWRRDNTVSNHNGRGKRATAAGPPMATTV
ncbi:hypothetical protein GALMADRAFT_208929 [Galerina marginata CBS 339.88]|uniref:MARVEL domain-containing protein n=1 Tax=Galerina marginata (strain CBS 339.88) TaxID=685588 RepID=A0A067TKY3_GALM3|nr:hypothetical protein GALMADRAFT_208929 [Galerina marginata CBS 339.88]